MFEQHDEVDKINERKMKNDILLFCFFDIFM